MYSQRYCIVEGIVQKSSSYKKEKARERGAEELCSKCGHRASIAIVARAYLIKG